MNLAYVLASIVPLGIVSSFEYLYTSFLDANPNSNVLINVSLNPSNIIDLHNLKKYVFSIKTTFSWLQVKSTLHKQ